MTLKMTNRIKKEIVVEEVMKVHGVRNHLIEMWFKSKQIKKVKRKLLLK